MLTGRFFAPSFEEGRPRRSNDVTLPRVIGAAGEVRPLCCDKSLTSPAAPCFKVARHFFTGRSDPSSKEGIADSSFDGATPCDMTCKFLDFLTTFGGLCKMSKPEAPEGVREN